MIIGFSDYLFVICYIQLAIRRSYNSTEGEANHVEESVDCIHDFFEGRQAGAGIPLISSFSTHHT